MELLPIIVSARGRPIAVVSVVHELSCECEDFAPSRQIDRNCLAGFAVRNGSPPVSLPQIGWPAAPVEKLPIAGVKNGADVDAASMCLNSAGLHFKLPQRAIANDGRRQARCADRLAILGYYVDGPELHSPPEFQRMCCADDLPATNAVHVRRINVHTDDSVSLVAGECATN